MAIILARQGFWDTQPEDPVPPPRIAFGIAVPTILGSLLVMSTTVRGWIRIPLPVLAAIVSYPFVLVPTFAVPLSITLHVYVISRLWTAATQRTDRSPRDAPGAS